MIRVAGLEVGFGHGRRRVHAVQNVSFTVPEGASYGLVGESGSGKTTALRAIAALVPPAAGRIEVDGRQVAARPDRAFRKKVQMVFQDPYGSLHPRHTVDRILREPCRIHGLGDIDGRIGHMLAEVGLGPAFRFRFPHQLSGGQRQRVAIARALILEPRVLLLDEPTSALDVSVQAEILNLLGDLRAARGLTFLFVSHNLAVVAQMCERVAVMMNGRVVEEADAGQLAAGALAHPYARQLLQASRGYDRELARSLVRFE
ncbi:ABC transporter ATP-binding protein [Marinimicrococcus flavescens]|uniref:Glutathione import ATP-binding protein GsiA n=1 Tax=Marinimicrococcus flavescens TaxID=3031815 RepID=A0AAP3UYJ0_9PROT|nr:ABC transporter ATP-binding protein [Marinimicrococcus flavescens]